MKSNVGTTKGHGALQELIKYQFSFIHSSSILWIISKNVLTDIFSIKKLNDYDNNFVNKQEVTLSRILKILMGYFKYCIIFSLAICPVSGYSQPPDFCGVRHDIGKIALVRSNYPEFGGSNFVDFPLIDCLTGSEIPLGSCLYPRNSLVTYLGFGFAWVGGIVKGDTLVSARAMWPSFQLYPSGDGFEFHSHDYPLGHIETRSNLDPLIG